MEVVQFFQCNFELLLIPLDAPGSLKVARVLLEKNVNCL